MAITLIPRGMMNDCSIAVKAVVSLENELSSELTYAFSDHIHARNCNHTC